MKSIIGMSLLAFSIFSVPTEAAPGIFDPKGPSLELVADFDALFATATSSDLDGDGAEDSEHHRAEVPGTLILTPTTGSPEVSVLNPRSVPVRLSIRGDTSVTDCSFKKIKIDFKKKDAAGTALEGFTSLRVNTHCSERSASGYTPSNMRVAGERGPVRESFVYDLLHALALPTYRSRLVNLKYRQRPRVANSTFSALKRRALLLENKNNLGTDYGGAVIDTIDPTKQDPAPLLDTIDRAQMARVELFQALIGNLDHSLGIPDLAGERFEHPEAMMPPLWNYALLLKPPAAPLLIPYDFDVAPMVLQQKWRSALSDPVTRTLSGCVTVLCERIFADLQNIRALIPRAQISDAIDFFGKQKSLINATLENSVLDAVEKSFARKRVIAFYDVINNRFSAPVIAQGGARFYRDEALSRACGDEDPQHPQNMTIPIGYLVQVLEARPLSIRVRIVGQPFRPMYNPLNETYCSNGEGWIDSRVKISKEW